MFTVNYVRILLFALYCCGCGLLPSKHDLVYYSQIMQIAVFTSWPQFWPIFPWTYPTMYTYTLFIYPPNILGVNLVDHWHASCMHACMHVWSAGTQGCHTVYVYVVHYYRWLMWPLIGHMTLQLALESGDHTSICAHSQSFLPGQMLSSLSY